MMLCSECKYLAGISRGYISTRFYCKLAPGDGHNRTGLGVHPWYNKPHPKCPLKKNRENIK